MLSTSATELYGCTATSGGAAYLVDSQLSSLNVHSCVALQDGGGVVVTGRSGINATRISACRAEGNGGALWVASSASARVNDTIMMQNNAGNSGGAAYVVASGSLAVDQVVFSSNSAAGHGKWLYLPRAMRMLTHSSGGAIFASGSLFMDKCVVTNNTAQGSGGGMLVDSTAGRATVRSTSLVHNKATGNGGAIAQASGSEAVLQHVTFDMNRARNGGSLSVVDSVVNVDSSVFGSATVDTSAEVVFGGAVYIYSSGNADSHSKRTVVSRCVFQGMRAGSGGAIAVVGSTVDLFKVDIKGCNAREFGGALFAQVMC